MLVDNTLEALLKAGFAKRFAERYLSCLKEERNNPLIDRELLEWSHSHGFLAENVVAWGINDSNYRDYMSDYEWHQIWPLNGWQRIWINDKMTLKYMLNGTEYGNVMPEYYFYMSHDGLRELIDNPYQGSQNIETLIKVLEEKGEMACKPNNGSLGEGFYRLNYTGGGILLTVRKRGWKRLNSLYLAKKMLFTLSS